MNIFEWKKLLICEKSHLKFLKYYKHHNNNKTKKNLYLKLSCYKPVPKQKNLHE